MQRSFPFVLTVAQAKYDSISSNVWLRPWSVCSVNPSLRVPGSRALVAQTIRWRWTQLRWTEKMSVGRFVYVWRSEKMFGSDEVVLKEVHLQEKKSIEQGNREEDQSEWRLDLFLPFRGFCCYFGVHRWRNWRTTVSWKFCCDVWIFPTCTRFAGYNDRGRRPASAAWPNDATLRVVRILDEFPSFMSVSLALCVLS